MRDAAQGGSPQIGQRGAVDAPLHLPLKSWQRVLRHTYDEFNKDRAMLAAAGATYYLLLALVPTLTAFVSIYGLFTDPATVTDQVSVLAGIVPSGGMEIIHEQLTRLTTEGGTTLGVTLLISLAVALWSSSAGIKALFEAMNIAYGEDEKRNFLQLNLIALVFTLGGVVAMLLCVSVIVVLPGLLAVVQLSAGFEWLARIISYLVMLLVLALGIAALYRWGPSRERAKWRWLTPGTLVAVVGSLIVSVLFSWYVSNFGNYNATYGSLGAVVGLMTWLWLTVTALVLGAELNSEVERETGRETAAAKPPPTPSAAAIVRPRSQGPGPMRPDAVDPRLGRPPVGVGAIAAAVLLVGWLATRRRLMH